MPFPGISGAPLLIKETSAPINISDVFRAQTWIGNGVSQTITSGVDGSSGCLIWIKSATAANDHVLVDTTRGISRYMASNQTNAESLNANTVSAISSTGYSIGSFPGVNASGATQVGWQFKQNSRFFGISSYTGNGSASISIASPIGPSIGLIIVKCYSSAGGWVVWNRAYPSINSILNSSSDGISSEISVSGSTVTISNSTNTLNANGSNYVVYFFAHDSSPSGVIQVGSYTGNGSTSGPTISLGWRPQLVLIKSVNTPAVVSAGWIIMDTARGIANRLLANTNGAQTSVGYISLLTNGFQIVDSTFNTNFSGSNYIYMAIRES